MLTVIPVLTCLGGDANKEMDVADYKNNQKGCLCKRNSCFSPNDNTNTSVKSDSNRRDRARFHKGDVPPACRSEACTSRCHRAPAASGPCTRRSAPRRVASSQDERSKTTKTESKPRPLGLDPGPRLQPAESERASSLLPTDRRTRPTAAAASVPAPPPCSAPSAGPWPARGRGGASRSPHGGPTPPPPHRLPGERGAPRCAAGVLRRRVAGSTVPPRPAPPVCRSVPRVRALLAVVSEVKAAQSRLPGGQ